MLAKHTYPAPPPNIRHIATLFRVLGWIGFWTQLAMTFISGIALLIVVTGSIFMPGTYSNNDFGILSAMFGVVVLILGVVSHFRYVRIARALLHEPGAVLHPRKLETARMLRIGAVAGFCGILLALVGSATSVGVLLAKTVSQPPGVAIVDPTKIVRAIDVFVVLANLTLIAAHLVGTVIAFWLLDRLHIHHHHHQSHL